MKFGRSVAKGAGLGACALFIAAAIQLFVAGSSTYAAPASAPATSEGLLVNATTAPAATAPATLPALPALSPAEAAAVARLRASVYFLASDALEGRGLDTKGIDLAADYIAVQFQQAGLQPIGAKDYFHYFDLTRADAIDPATELSFGDKRYSVGDDFTVSSFSAETKFDAPVVFVGYGITDAAHHYDDYAGIDVKGKIALAMRLEPVDEKGVSRLAGDQRSGWSSNSYLDTKVKVAAEHGAVALILVNPPKPANLDPLMPFAKQFRGGAALLPLVQVKISVADEWLARGGLPELKTLRDKIDKDFKPQSQAMNGVQVKGQVALKRTIRHLKNIVGLLPGKGARANEYVIVGAHYDHLGRGGPGSLAPGSHEIHHGADDNASGTASIIELARRFGHAADATQPSGRELSRSVLFICFSAEEEGLIGSQNFVTHPPIALQDVAAMLNLDMVGRLRDQQLFIGGAGTAPSLQHVLDEAKVGSPLELKDIGKGGLGPSDHMSFALKKVPVLFFFTGLHADYHRPTDTAEKINYRGMAEIVDFSQKVIAGLCDMPKERYVDAADAHSMTMGGIGGGNHTLLGVIPQYGDESAEIKGVRISGARAGTPAAAAGLQEGDIITQFGTHKIGNLMDLSAALDAFKPGDKVELKVTRGRQELTLPVTLGERKE